MGRITISNIYHYIVGNIRYKLYYSKYDYLIPKHIREQIDLRIMLMDSECYNTGSCIKCGCKTTALQMANKACDGDCYMPMLSKKDWDSFMEDKYVYLLDNDILWEYYLCDNVVYVFKDSVLTNSKYV